MPPPSKGGGGKGDSLPPIVSATFNHGLWVMDRPFQFNGSDFSNEPRSRGRTRNLLTQTDNNAPRHRYAYDAPFGGYCAYNGTAESEHAIQTDVADNISELFVTAIVRSNSPAADDKEYLFGRGVATGKSIDWRFGTDRILSQVVNQAGTPFVASHTHTSTVAGRWCIVHYCYKLNTHTKVGMNGIWLATTAVTSTALQAGTGGMAIGQDAPTELFKGDVALLGVATAIPADNQLRSLSVALSGVINPGKVYNDPIGDGGTFSSGSANAIRFSRLPIMGVR